MKLEINHLSPYLPYSLKVIMEGKKCNVAWMSTKNIAIIRPDGIGEYKRIPWKRAEFNIKPILRPLSDFNYRDNWGYAYKEMFYEDVKNKTIAVKLLEELLEDHIDVFGLIENGLAIDINTLNQ